VTKTQKSPHDRSSTPVKGFEDFVRRLQSADWIMETVAPTTGFFLYQVMDQMKAKCRVDLSEIGLKLSMQLLGADGLLHIPTDDETSAEQASLWNPLMDAVAPLGELQCNNTQYTQFQTALLNFQTCTNSSNSNVTTINAQSSSSSSNIFHTMGEHCGISALLADTENCTDALLSNNQTLTTLQDVYQHTGMYCQCSSKLRNELPSCFVTVADMIQQDAATVDPAYFKMKFSLGFFQSTMLCAVDLGCHAMDGWCVRQINELQQCLGENPACKTGTNLTSVCEGNDIFTLPYQLTQGKLPDVCLNAVVTHHLNASVVSEFDTYVQTCRLQDERNKLASSASQPQQQQQSGQDNSWIITVVSLVGVVLLAFAVIIARRSQRRTRQRPRQPRFQHDEVIEQEELHEFGIQPMS
jgi:cytoskeletal protein RodZ